MIRAWLNLHIKKQQGFIFPGPSSLVFSENMRD